MYQEQNYRAICAIMAQHGVLLRDPHKWVALEPTQGYILGAELPGIALATDGELILLLQDNGQTVFGHKKWFSRKVKNMFSGATANHRRKSKPKKKSKRQRMLDML